MKQYDLEKSNVVKFNESEVALDAQNVNVYYGQKQAIFNISMQFPKNKITAFIGASGSGKSTLLRSINRMNDGIARVDGKVLYQGLNLNDPKVNVYELRKEIGMVFQQPNPFAKSIRGNITFAPEKLGEKNQAVLDKIVESSLKKAALWDEIKADLGKSAFELSGGQAQRLCIARSIAMNPQILLLDEPTSALDPISTKKIEETLRELSKDYTVIIVTHNMQQASRFSDYTAFFHMGHLIEFDTTENIFTRPQLQATDDYVTGHFG